MADYTADGYIVAPTIEVTAPVADPYTVGPDFRGGYYGEQTGSIGGGYDPDNPSYGNQSNSIGGDVAVTETYTGAPSFAGGYYGEQSDEGGGGYDPSLAGLSDPTNARLETSGLRPGGESSDPKADPSVAFQSTKGSKGAASASENDWRVRISLADRATIFYKDPNGSAAIMAPLIKTNGVIFPYTPSIIVTHAANYTPVNPTHSNYPQQFYNNSEVSDITIQGEFTVQSISEGQYLMAAIYFFRSATKMFFGSGANVGNPPPVVFLDGYGSHYFPHVPCVISSFSHVLSPDVDYLQIPITTTTLEDVAVTNDNMNIGTVQLTTEEQQNVPSLLRSNPPANYPNQQLTRTQFQSITTNTRVPTSSQISITLKPVYSRKGLHDRFDLNKFAAGTLLQNKDKGYGGFL
jgi:hypothetical protein